MKRKVEYSWRLREVMADHRIHTATELIPLLRERGVDLSASQVVVADALTYFYKTTSRLAAETGTDWSRYAGGKVVVAIGDHVTCTVEEVGVLRDQIIAEPGAVDLLLQLLEEPDCRHGERWASADDR